VKLLYGEVLSNFAFNFNLRRYDLVTTDPFANLQGFTSALGGRALSVHSLSHIPSQVRTLVIPEVLVSVRGNFGRLCWILNDFSVDTLPKRT
jgi:hypothetical protein